MKEIAYTKMYIYVVHEEDVMAAVALASSSGLKERVELPERFFSDQGVTKRCRLSWLTNSAIVYEPKCGGGGCGGSQPMSTAVHRSPNKLWRSNSIFNLCF
jgi:hypothetical protein